VQLFGPHLIIDGSRCDTQKLGDRILIEQLLSDYPTAIGMTKIGGPYMFEYQAPDPAYSGVSGIVVIAESHIAIHTFPALDYFTLDIFSCKNFDHEKAIQYIKDALDVREMDRMLVQRGLSFRGPHHGADGATDQLIAAAEARLAAGIVSNETVELGETSARRTELVTERTDGLAHGAPHGEPPDAGRMLWPQYGVTPDRGTYGEAAAEIAADRAARRTTPHVGEPNGAESHSSARGGALIVPLHGATEVPTDRAGAPLPTTEPFQVNPTASISGLLDKLGGIGQGSRALSRALDEWERWARDPSCTLVLTLATPIIAAGLRELLVYTIEHRYIDVVIATGDDLYADLHEALGHGHYVDGDELIVTETDSARTAAFVTEFVTKLAEQRGSSTISGRDVLRALGEAMPSRAPRKGLLQAAASAGVSIYAPDLLAGSFGAALLAARAAGAELHVDLLADLTTLAGELGVLPRLGVIDACRGLPGSFLAQALALMDGERPATSMIMLGGTSPRGVAGALLVESEPVVALPLLVSALAQRIPGTRGLRARARQNRAGRTEEHALAQSPGTA
jgi:S-adenosylmethionine decarboxylase